MRHFIYNSHYFISLIQLREKNYQTFSRSSGFTLIELMIVVAVIAMLAAIVIPSYNGYIKQSKAKAFMMQADKCKGSLDKILSDGGNIGSDLECNSYFSFIETLSDETRWSIEQEYAGAFEELNNALKRAQDAQTKRSIDECKKKYSDPVDYSDCIINIEEPKALPGSEIPEVSAENMINENDGANQKIK